MYKCQALHTRPRAVGLVFSGYYNDCINKARYIMDIKYAVFSSKKRDF